MPRSATVAVLTAAAVGLSGCSAVNAVEDALWTGPCTTVGLGEGVSVDLTTVLPFEGGPYQVTVTLPGAAEPATATVDPRQDGPLTTGLVVDLDDEPVEVRVEARGADGALVYRAAGRQTPVLDQPNGPRCDPEDFSLWLQATPSGQLVPLPRSEPARDARGRVSMTVDTRCGVERLDDPHGLMGSRVRVEGPLDDGTGGTPAGWDAPRQRGWADVRSDQLVFEDERGHRELFRPATADDVVIPCWR